MRLRDTVSTPRRGEKGFTITEVLVATTLTAVALVAVSSFNRFQLLTLRNQANQIDLQTTARSVVDLFAREIRRAGANPTCVGGLSALTDAKTYSVRVVADLNRDGATNGANEDLTYRYNLGSNTVERVDQNGGTTDVLVSGASLGNSRIRYFDGNGTEGTLQCLSIRMVPVPQGLQGLLSDGVRRHEPHYK